MKKAPMLPLNLSKKCSMCGFETTEIKKYFHNCKAFKDGFKKQCKKCIKRSSFNYANTEHGFITNTFNTIKKKINSKRFLNFSEEEKNKSRCYLNKKEFFNLWEEHKKIRGYTCHLTGVEIICKRSPHKKKLIGFSNGASVDRLNPNIGYTKENTIFISNDANKIKNAVTKELCIEILRVYKEKGL
jgi:hypothetical protein